MKKLIIVLAILALAIPCLSADDPPDVTLTIVAKIDSWGGSAYGAQYLLSCEEEGGKGCTITDQETVYLPKVGPVLIVRWCNTWGQCNSTLLKMEMD